MSSHKVVLITGASTGFGRSAAEMLSRKGHTVFASMRDPEGRNSIHSEALRFLGIAVVAMDVTEEASVEAAVRNVLQQAGHIDVVINNAGIGAIGVTEAFTVEQFRQIMDVNLLGAVRVNRAVLPSMRRRREGLLIHVSSGAGRISIPCMAPYCASKFALEALADAYRFELTPYGVDSVLVEPGAHRTPILEKFNPPDDALRIEEYGSEARYAERVRGFFDAANVSPDTLGPEAVAQAFIDLIEMPSGQRPLRTVPTPGLREGLAAYNAAAEAMRENTAARFRVPELLTPEV